MEQGKNPIALEAIMRELWKAVVKEAGGDTREVSERQGGTFEVPTNTANRQLSAIGRWRNHDGGTRRTRCKGPGSGVSGSQARKDTCQHIGKALPNTLESNGELAGADGPTWDPT